MVAKWFHSAGEPNVREARWLREQLGAGQLRVVVPSLLNLELMNIASRRWRLRRPELLEFADAIAELGFEVHEPRLRDVAAWTARGLTAYDSAYVAVAESESLKLVTADSGILASATAVAIALSSLTQGRANP